MSISNEGHRQRRNSLEVPVLALAFVLVNVLSATFQQTLSLRDGRGIDGVTYCKVSEQLSRGELPSGQAPYVFRLGTPYLVSIALRSGLEVVQAFKVVNLGANAVALVTATPKAATASSVVIFFIGEFPSRWMKLCCVLLLFFVLDFRSGPSSPPCQRCRRTQQSIL